MKLRSPISLSAAILATTAMFSSVASAADARSIEISGNDQMKFSVATIEAKAGEQLKVVFKNAGTLPKQAMGHNWVLLKKGSDVAAFGAAAAGAAGTDYIPASQKDKIIVHTKVLGPKETQEVTFTVPSEAGDYPFLCSFPGHFALMKGTLKVK